MATFTKSFACGARFLWESLKKRAPISTNFSRCARKFQRGAMRQKMPIFKGKKVPLQWHKKSVFSVTYSRLHFTIAKRMRKYGERKDALIFVACTPNEKKRAQILRYNLHACSRKLLGGRSEGNWLFSKGTIGFTFKQFSSLLAAFEERFSYKF